jgi:transcriptional enhancer factor
MDHIRPTRPFTYSSQLQLQLDNLSTARQPLSNLAGNAQPHTLPLVNLHHDHKDSRPGSDRTLRSAPTVPSQPQWRNIGSALDLRRQSIRKGRHLKFSRNPIVDSPQYKAYRERQTREEDLKDAKWPNVLEDAFLDGKLPSFGLQLEP